MNDAQSSGVRGMDVPIANLVPVQRRTVSDREFHRLVANIKAVGLIDPLLTCQEGDQFFILDGYIRYTALASKEATLPCLVIDSRDLYTANRQVSHLTREQQTTLLRQALERIDEKTIAQAFGLENIGDQCGSRPIRGLHPDVAAAVEKGDLPRRAGNELTHVVADRQVEILRMTRDGGDSSLAFVKAQVLATPEPGHARKRGRKITPWAQRGKARNDLTKKFTQAQKDYDFYVKLYHQYVEDSLRLAIYVRQIITRPVLRDYLRRNHPGELEFLESIVSQGGDGASG